MLSRRGSICTYRLLPRNRARPGGRGPSSRIPRPRIHHIFDIQLLQGSRCPEGPSLISVSRRATQNGCREQKKHRGRGRANHGGWRPSQGCQGLITRRPDTVAEMRLQMELLWVSPFAIWCAADVSNGRRETCNASNFARLASSHLRYRCCKTARA